MKNILPRRSQVNQCLCLMQDFNHRPSRHSAYNPSPSEPPSCAFRRAARSFDWFYHQGSSSLATLLEKMTDHVEPTAETAFPPIFRFLILRRFPQAPYPEP